MKKKIEEKELKLDIQDTFNSDVLDELNDEEVEIENIFESEVVEDGKENN